MILLTDSISQSSNFCWIVLDETTYYISAFAVDSNGTIIDVQTMSITTSFVWKFEYDFRWKTVAQMQSDWFEIFRWSTSQLSFNSYWIYVNNSTEPSPMWRYTNSNLISRIRNANKITLTMICLPYSWWSIWYRLYRIADYNTRADITWIYSATDLRQTHIYWTWYNDNISSNWSRTMKCEIDFVAKTLTTSDTLWYSRTWNLSDTQITNIKWNSNWIYNNMSYSSWTSTWLQSIKIEIK